MLRQRGPAGSLMSRDLFWLGIVKTSIPSCARWLSPLWSAERMLKASEVRVSRYVWSRRLCSPLATCCRLIAFRQSLRAVMPAT